jgi:cytochrome o ubiquinol oxidase subunit 3
MSTKHISSTALSETVAESPTTLSSSKVNFGFWLYLMTDCVLFATLFATFAVLRNNTFGGPGGSELFKLPYVLIETLLLLTSSFTCGLAMLSAGQNKRQQVMIWFSITFLLGLAFLGMELSEFRNLVVEGNSWRRSGFLSAFFTLVGTHGLHITIGLVWIGTMLIKIAKKGITASSLKRLALLSMFWHFLDIIWIFIFTFVYLIGTIQL